MDTARSSRTPRSYPSAPGRRPPVSGHRSYPIPMTRCRVCPRHSPSTGDGDHLISPAWEEYVLVAGGHMCDATLDKGFRPGAGRRWWLKVLARLARTVAAPRASRFTPAPGPQLIPGC
ncbi:hypothetical protein NLS1_07850 [Nocardioides sp. LS1]|nr:hypothetical protein NLS1_07850 [Nocardioides sp. LS1]